MTNKNSDTYRRKTQKERQHLFDALAHQMGHAVINIMPPKNKNKIKDIRKDSRLSGAEAAVICGVSRRSWTMWENHNKADPTKDTYPSDWQWGWFLLAINQHPNLQLVAKDQVEGGLSDFDVAPDNIEYI